MPIVATFSIVACDLEAKEFGVAVQSKFFGVGAVVPWVQLGAGAVATQAFANTSYGPRGLELLRLGIPAAEAVSLLTRDDPDADRRQLAIVDRNGRAAAHTGENCMDWAGHCTGEHHSCQGNILAGPEVPRAMSAAFEGTQGPLADRMISALAAGQSAGGDRRGRQSAALLIHKPDAGYGGFNDRYLDLRVDDHATPIRELARLLELHRLYFSGAEREAVPLQDKVLEDVHQALGKLGYDVASEGVEAALTRFHHYENFEERQTKPHAVDRDVLGYLLRRAARS